MFGAEKGGLTATDHKLDGKKLYIGLVQARFNESITNTLAEACKAELLALGVLAKHIDHITVPGALEVPAALQALAEKDTYDALIALGYTTEAREALQFVVRQSEEQGSTELQSRAQAMLDLMGGGKSPSQSAH